MGEPLTSIVAVLANINERLSKLEELSRGEGFANYSDEELNELQWRATLLLQWLADRAKEEAGGDG